MQVERRRWIELSACSHSRLVACSVCITRQAQLPLDLMAYGQQRSEQHVEMPGALPEPGGLRPSCLVAPRTRV